MLLFLKINQDLWDANTVSEAIRKTPDDSEASEEE
jgi:hypothetical protein